MNSTDQSISLKNGNEKMRIKGKKNQVRRSNRQNLLTVDNHLLQNDIEVNSDIELEELSESCESFTLGKLHSDKQNEYHSDF